MTTLLEPVRKLGRDTARTINEAETWKKLIPEAPHVFRSTSDSVEVSPAIYKYCPGGYDNQIIGMCVGKGTKNGAGTILRIPPGATFDPAHPEKDSPPMPTIRLSGMWCYYNARNIHGGAGWGEGAVVAYSLDAIMKCGLIPEDMWPDTDAYQSAYSDRKPPSDADVAEGARHVILHAARITSRQQYFDFLSQGFPIIDGVEIGSGWMSTAEDGKFSLDGRTVGGHCTLTVGYDRKLNRLYKRNSWMGWGAVTTDPEFNTTDPKYKWNANGRNNIGYCALDQYESRHLSDNALSSGNTDAFVINDIPWDRGTPPVPKIAYLSAVGEFE